jgi:hypothetical protein
MIEMKMSVPIDMVREQLIPGSATARWRVFEDVLLGFLSGERLKGLAIHVSEQRDMLRGTITRTWKTDPIDRPESEARELNARFFKLLGETPAWRAVTQPRKLRLA